MSYRVLRLHYHDGRNEMSTPLSKYELENLKLNQQILKINNGNKNMRDIQNEYNMIEEDFLCLVADSNVLLLDAILENL